MGEHEPPHPPHEDDETTASPVRLIDVRDPLPEDLRDPSFPGAVRGYDRRAVDDYVQRINQLIAELQVSGSPPAAVRHALDRVGEQTSSILHRARETAEEITRSAREEAEGTVASGQAQAGQLVQDARAKADEIVALANDQCEDMRSRARADAEATAREAEERMRALEAEIAAVAHERRVAVEEIRQMAARLEAAVAEAGSDGATVALRTER